MFREFFCALIFCSIVIHKSRGQIPTFECKINKDWRIIPRPKIDAVDIRIYFYGCKVFNASLTSSKKNFKLDPRVKNVHKVTWIQFVSSQVEILTKDVCETLPYLIGFNGVKLV